MSSVAKTYVTPAMRAAIPRTEKKALKKEFAIDQGAFPSLGETIKKNGISFSSAAAKKVETPQPVIIDVLPGWVHIRKHQGKIQYKYGKAIVRSGLDAEQVDEIVSRIILKNRIAREQYDRNLEIERLGDLSEFYDQPTLAEIYENDVEDPASAEDSESSDYSEGEF
jgi:hypothetical protein